MKKMIALVVSIAFSLGVAGFAAAQAPAAKPAEAPKAEQKADKTEKKAKETKADCLKMAKDDAGKADCEKKYAKGKKEAATAAPKKEEAKKP
jgi:uncharacterized protein HemX